MQIQIQLSKKLEDLGNIRVISHENRPLSALYPLLHAKKCFIGLLWVVAGGVMIMPTASATLSIVSA